MPWDPKPGRIFLQQRKIKAAVSDCSRPLSVAIRWTLTLRFSVVFIRLSAPFYPALRAYMLRIGVTTMCRSVAKMEVLKHKPECCKYVQVFRGLVFISPALIRLKAKCCATCRPVRPAAVQLFLHSTTQPTCAAWQRLRTCLFSQSQRSRTNGPLLEYRPCCTW